MRNGLLITGAAIAALVAGGASATIHKSNHRSHTMGADMYAAPSQPIPYAQLDNYLAANPTQRASIGDSGASMGSAPASQASDTSMAPSPATSPDPAPAAATGDQMGAPNASGADGMTGSSGAPPASGDTGAASAPPPATDSGSPDGSASPPK